VQSAARYSGPRCHISKQSGKQTDSLANKQIESQTDWQTDIKRVERSARGKITLQVKIINIGI